MASAKSAYSDAGHSEHSLNRDCPLLFGGKEAEIFDAFLDEFAGEDWAFPSARELPTASPFTDEDYTGTLQSRHRCLSSRWTGTALAHRARIYARGWPETRAAEQGVGPNVQHQRICHRRTLTARSVGTGFVDKGSACHCVNSVILENTGSLEDKKLLPGRSASRFSIKTEMHSHNTTARTRGDFA